MGQSKDIHNEASDLFISPKWMAEYEPLEIFTGNHPIYIMVKWRFSDCHAGSGSSRKTLIENLCRLECYGI